MWPVSRVYRNASLAACFTLAATVGAACGGGVRGADSVKLIDLLPSAERRAGSKLDEAVHAADIGSGADRSRALLMRAPARVVWMLTFPSHAELHTAVALVPDVTNPSGPLGPGVTVRIGIADSRSYEEVIRVPVPPPQPGAPFWTPIDLDLGLYGGWQWSLFYRPWNITWRFNFSADALPGPGTVAWREPIIAR